MSITSLTRFTVSEGTRMLGIDGWVYFVLCPELNLLKIGWTQNPPERFQALRVGMPYPIAMLTARAGSRADEAALHARYQDMRVSGEWFRYRPRLRRFVASVLKKHGPTPWPAPLKLTKYEAALERAVQNGKASYIAWPDEIEHRHLFGGRAS